MKNSWSFTRNQNGFAFPLVLLASAAILLFVSNGIQMYQAESKITDDLLEQLKVETIFQTSNWELRQIISEANGRELPSRYKFEHPHGSASVHLNSSNEGIYQAIFNIETDTGTYHIMLKNFPMLEATLQIPELSVNSFAL